MLSRLVAAPGRLLNLVDRPAGVRGSGVETGLRARERRLSLALEAAGEGLVDWNVASGEAFFSPLAERLLGFEAGGVRPCIEAWRERCHPDDRLRVAAALNRHFRGELPRFELEHRVLRRDGTWVWVRIRGAVVEHDAGGRPRRVVGLVCDVTERKRAQMEIEWLARHDPLTGLSNRVRFREDIDLACRRATRTGGKVALLYLDLDGFKLVNDSLGHAAGDMLLVEVAARLRECVRRTDSLARLGGDEFAVIAGEQKKAAAYGALAERIIAAIAEPCRLQGAPVRNATSIGIALFPDHAAGAEHLLDCADAALYRAKANGRNTWFLYDGGRPALAGGHGGTPHRAGEVSPGDAAPRQGAR